MHEHKELIGSIAHDDAFLTGLSVTGLEQLRLQLRGLIQFVADSGAHKVIVTDLTDPLIERTENQPFDITEHFEDYKLKVNRYVNEHREDGVIRKLRHNEPLDADDYSELERIFMRHLGSRDEYNAAFGPKPLGLLIRRIVKLDHQAAMDAFADFINGHVLNQAQIEFVHRVIAYIERNGYVEPADLTKPPFDHPRPMMKLFDSPSLLSALVLCVTKVRDNAMVGVAQE